jgi:hypothetical protein
MASRLKRIEKKVTRLNVPHPETGQASLTQDEIAHWPHCQPEIKLGKLGEECNLKLEVTNEQQLAAHFR